MEFRLLGPLEVAEDGRPVSLGGSRACALLALLLLHRNQVVAVDRIVDELWERPPKTGTQVVRVYVSQLRKALEAGRSDEPPRVLLTRRSGYLLKVDPEEVDLDRFEALRAEGRRLLDAGEIPDAASTLREALSLWRGPPLQDFAYEAFAQPEIARLEELHLATLEELFEAQLAAGRGSELVADLEQLLKANPLRERLRAQLMLALYRAGRPADALETYQRGRRISVDELGLEPGEILRQLETKILQQDPELDQPKPPPPPMQTPAQPPPRRRRLAVASVALLVIGGATTAALLTAAAPNRGQPAAAHDPTRVALVVEGSRSPSNMSPEVIDQINGLDTAAADSSVQTRVLYGGYQLRGFLRTTARAARNSDLVIVGPTPNAEGLAELTRRFPSTHFLVLGPVFNKPSAFTGQRNVTGIHFNEYENGYLGGYLAALMTHGKQAVSAIAGGHAQPVPDLINGFKAGARHARPNIRVLVTYTNTFINQGVCEAAANQQIHRGSTVVFDVAGECGLGALDAVGIDGARALSADSNLSNYGPQMLGSVVDRLDRVTAFTVTLFAAGQLPGGQDLPLDLASGAIGLVGINHVPQTVRAKVEAVAARLTARDQANIPR
jgi:DNA-binding SARP family transcriptional activator/basic membrane lipoprotein Med (substrate-binding protein (PBP1-ABC) superfamily)